MCHFQLAKGNNGLALRLQIHTNTNKKHANKKHANTHKQIVKEHKGNLRVFIGADEKQLDPTVLIDTWTASIHRDKFCDPCWLDGALWHRYCHWDPKNGGFKLIYFQDKANDKTPEFVITIQQININNQQKIVFTIHKNQLKLESIYKFVSKKL